MSLGNCRYCGKKWIYVKRCNDCGDICCDKCATYGTQCRTCNSTNRVTFEKNSERKNREIKEEREEVNTPDSFDALGERYAHFKGVMGENWDTLSEEEKADKINKMNMIMETVKANPQETSKEDTPILIKFFGWIIVIGLVLVLFAMFPIFTIIVGILAAIGYFCKDK